MRCEDSEDRKQQSECRHRFGEPLARPGPDRLRKLQRRKIEHQMRHPNAKYTTA